MVCIEYTLKCVKGEIVRTNIDSGTTANDSNLAIYNEQYPFYYSKNSIIFY